MTQVEVADSAVRSIRIANTLADRFRAIAATDTASSFETLELLIGEAQQIYPEMWRHLDDARRALVARGRDVSEFDAYRRHELVDLGVPEVEITEDVDYVALMLGQYRERYIKTASFNLGGANRAIGACRALMDVMPEVDWAEVVRAEDRAIAAAGSLWSHRWVGMAKGLAFAGAAIAAAVIIYRYATAPSPPSYSAADEANRAAAEAAMEADAKAARELAAQRGAKLAELREAYETTCDRKHLPELVALMRETLQASAAAALESRPCVPRRPSCVDVRDAVAARLAGELALERDDDWRLDCQGVVIAGARGVQPALAVVVTARGPGTKLRTLRGLVSTDGARDLVPFAEAPVPTFVGIDDLDAEPSPDELVMVGPKRIVVTRLGQDGFVDLEGPALPAGCRATVSVARDFRSGRKGERHFMVVTVDDPSPRKGCPPTGRHYYGLVDGALVEDVE